MDADGIHRVDAAGMDYWLHRTGDGPAQAPAIPEEPRAERAEPDDLDRVYRALLAQLSVSPAHRTALLERGLDDEAITQGLYRTLPPRGRAELAREVLERFPSRLALTVPGFHVREGNGRLYTTVAGPAGLLIPVRDLEGRVVALKVRRDRASDDEGRYVYVSSTAYGGPGPGAPVHMPATGGKLPSAELEVHPVVRITEGELKAHVATQLSGVRTLSVAGVSAWRSALPALRALQPSQVLLAFDLDAATNPHVARATEATAQALEAEGWEVGVEVWDGERAKGIDNALAAGVAIEVRTRTVSDAEATPAEELASSEPGPYRATREGLVWSRPTKDGCLDQRLTNFTACIATDVVEDDGVELRRRFELEARLNGSCSRFTVDAESFAGMGWATEHLGAQAIVYPGMGLKDHARAAVQILSGDVAERRVFAHSGWRELESGWAWLHAGGAIGAYGQVAGVEVALPEALERLALPALPDGDELVAAVRASLGVLEVAPDPISVGLLASVYRAVLGPCDFSLHLAGSSGAGKSELAALAQRHFGQDFDARHLPGSWSSTANALEALAFAAKDAMLVVDDFAPTNGAGDVERAHRDADRLLRAQGNRSGRLRMRQDGSLRAAKPPRGLILSTGEDLPKGQSLRARILVLEVGRDDVDWARMTGCQHDASAGRFAQALSGFLRWVAGRYEVRQEELAELVPKLRAKAAESGDHRRTPEIVANLAAGLGLFLAFGRSVGALSEAEHDALLERSWDALGEAARCQAGHQAPAEPARRFLELLRGAIASGRAHVAGLDGECPQTDPGAWGWRRNGWADWEAKGDRVGWVDGENLYLEPDAAYAAVQRLGAEVGDRIPLTPQTLRRRLSEHGVLVSSDARRRMLTVRRTLEGQRREVLHLDRETLAPSTEGADHEASQASWSATGSAAVGERSAPATSKTPLPPGHSPQMVGLVGISARERAISLFPDRRGGIE